MYKSTGGRFYESGDPALFMSSCWFPSLAPFNLWHQKPDQFLERKKLVWGGGEGSNETSRPIGACKATSDICWMQDWKWRISHKMLRDLFGDWENFLSTSALISSVNPVANLTEPLGSQYLVCFLHQQSDQSLGEFLLSGICWRCPPARYQSILNQGGGRVPWFIATLFAFFVALPLL